MKGATTMRWVERVRALARTDAIAELRARASASVASKERLEAARERHDEAAFQRSTTLEHEERLATHRTTAGDLVAIDGLSRRLKSEVEARADEVATHSKAAAVDAQKYSKASADAIAAHSAHEVVVARVASIEASERVRADDRAGEDHADHGSALRRRR